MEITKKTRPLYVRAHFNGKPVSKELVDNGSAVNVMPLRMLRVLARGIDDLIEQKCLCQLSIGKYQRLWAYSITP